MQTYITEEILSMDFHYNICATLTDYGDKFLRAGYSHLGVTYVRTNYEREIRLRDVVECC